MRWGGKRIRVTAQLTDAEAGSNIWADRYDRDVSDILDVQEEIRRLSSMRWARRSPRRSANGRWHERRRTSAHGKRINGRSGTGRDRVRAATPMHDDISRRRWRSMSASLRPMPRWLTYISRTSHGACTASHTRACGWRRTQARAAIALDPDNPSGHATLAWTFTHRGQMDLPRTRRTLR